MRIWPPSRASTRTAASSKGRSFYGNRTRPGKISGIWMERSNNEIRKERSNNEIRKERSNMKGAYLPGNSTVELKEVPVPAPGHGEVLLRMKASTICGSDIRCIYHEHLGKGPEGYQGVV